MGILRVQEYFYTESKTGYPSEPGFNLPDDSIPGGEKASLVFLISLSITFGVLLLLLVLISIYLTFCAGNDNEDSDEEEDGMPGSFKFFKKKNNLLLDNTFMTPGKFDDDEELREIEQAELPKMSEFEIALYKRAKEFQRMSPPMVKPFGTYLNSHDKQLVKDRGIQSYFLLPSINDNVDIDGNFLPSFIIEDKLNITFTKFNTSSSTIMNYPIPHNKKGAVYFEVKCYKYKSKSNSIFSIGLITCPYPYFRLPGMAAYSIAYESTGKLRINNSFSAATLLPKIIEGDVVGFGYRFGTGTIFITHNGKKLMDLTHGVGIDLFIGIGALNAAYTRTYSKDGLFEDPDNVSFRKKWTDVLTSPGKNTGDLINEQLLEVRDPNEERIDSDEIELQVNLGQLGFVFIEANVKKYAFGSVFGEIGIPPSYNGDEIKQDMLLQKGDELPPCYPSDELDFFGNMPRSSFPQEHTSSTETTSIDTTGLGSASTGNPSLVDAQNVPNAQSSSSSKTNTHSVSIKAKRKSKKKRKKGKKCKHK